LEDDESILGGLLDLQIFVLHLHDIGETLMLINAFRWLVDESDIVCLIYDQDCIKEGEDIKVSDNFIQGKGSDLKARMISVDSKHSNVLFLPTHKVEGIALFTVPQNGNDLMMRKFGECFFSESFIIECDLIPSNEADGGNGNYLEDNADAEIVIIDFNLFLNFLGLQPHLLHIIKIYYAAL
jgi:hypothetical protein